jgi:CheY-like chemotaxis protein
MLKLPAAIFVVEDEALIRMMLVEMIEELGHRVIAEAGNVRDAQALARTAIFDLAILDVNIAGYSISPVAEIIEKRACHLFLLPAMDQEVSQKNLVSGRCCRNRR